LKNKLRTKGLPVSGLAGLYCYFLLLADEWVQNQGISIWLIPNEFMDVNYGKTIKGQVKGFVGQPCGKISGTADDKL